MIDAAIAATYARARARRGVPVTIQRLQGYAPDVTIAASAQVDASILSDAGRRFSGSGDGETLSQDYRQIVVMAQDLVAQGFPLPLQKNDRIVLQGSTYKLDATNVDSDTRALAGAIVLSVSGTS